MKATDLVALIEATIKAKHNLMVTGSPGIGKTQLEVEAARRVKAENFIMYPSIGDPTDAKGFPFIVDGKADFVPFGELRRVYDAIEAGNLCALFLDDLGQGAPATQASYMSLMDRLRGKCAVIAATNRRSDRAGVQGVLEPVKSRFHAIVELQADLDDFCNHVIDTGETRYHLDEEAILDVVSFLRFRPEQLCNFNPTIDLSNSPCPRTWIAAAQTVSLKLPAHIEFEAIAGAVGQGTGGEFSAFKKMRRELPNLDGILLNPQAATIPTEPSVKWAVCTGLAAKANKSNFPRVHVFAQKLYDAGQGQFSALLVRDAVRRQPDIMETMDFQKLASGKIGDLISGTFRD
jgi:hypothetical protein